MSAFFQSIKPVPLARLSYADVAHFDGAFQWSGVVVASHRHTVVLMDGLGRMARVSADDGRFFLLSRQTQIESWVSSEESAILAIEARLLLRYGAVHTAIAAAASSDTDPAGYDIWRLPLSVYGRGDTLSSLGYWYAASPAPERRTFEAVLGFMRGHRQRQVVLENMMGCTSSYDLRRREGLRKSAIRMARMRARALLAVYVPDACA